MFDEINNVDGTLILILDEVDHIRTIVCCISYPELTKMEI